MLFRDFLKARKHALMGILALGLAGAGLEGFFVLSAKALLSDGYFPGFSAFSGILTRNRTDLWLPMTILFMTVSLRAVLQIAAAKMELRAVFGWIGEQRHALLRLTARRKFPIHRPPFRNTLPSAMGDDCDRIADGLIAGCRCMAAAAQAVVLPPLLFFFSWKLAAGALMLAVPALLASRLRVKALAEGGKRWNASRAELSLEMEGFVEGLESSMGNGRLAERAEGLSQTLSFHAGKGFAWETAKAIFPPALEWFFFLALAALAGLAAVSGIGGGAVSLLAFAVLLLLLYRPIREWARNFPVYALGAQTWRETRGLLENLNGLPPRARASRAAGTAIEISRLRFGYASPPSRAPTRFVFEDLDLELRPEAATWVTGKNGSGKSTLLKLLCGIESPQGGRILLPGALSTDAWPFGYLPQRAHVEPDYLEWRDAFRKARPETWSVLDGILGVETILSGIEAAKIRGGKSARVNPEAWTKNLSGGERQRLSLARVFASPGQFLLLDEPTTWLAAEDRERIMGDLLAFWKMPAGGPGRRGAAIVSHEPFLGEFCSHTIRMDALSGATPLNQSLKSGPRT